jgi:hypothetical protein
MRPFACGLAYDHGDGGVRNDLQKFALGPEDDVAFDDDRIEV